MPIKVKVIAPPKQKIVKVICPACQHHNWFSLGLHSESEVQGYVVVSINDCNECGAKLKYWEETDETIVSRQG